MTVSESDVSYMFGTAKCVPFIKVSIGVSNNEGISE